jgi:hypothetical protein
MKRRVALVVSVLFSLVLAVSLLAEKGASLAGTWKLNVEKSKSSTGSLPKSAVRTVDAQGDGEKTSCEEVEADGTRVTYGYTATYDDKDHPITSSRPDLFGGADNIALRKTGSNTYGAALKKSGQVVMTMRAVVSKNGQTLTITENGADSKGQPTTVVTVWDKSSEGGAVATK